jgi:uncharacterized protein YecE (DUF72 family)
MSGQLSLFGEPEPAPVARASASGVEGAAVPDALAQLAARLRPLVHLGTSSWAFPGWSGIVYQGPYDASRLSREGLRAYAAHPLLRTVSIDRSYYGPLDVATYRGYADQVPAGFRFMVKAPAECTTPWARSASGKPAGDNPLYLDPEFAEASFVRPALEGLGATCGPLVFQFPPQGRGMLRDPARFAARLHAFLKRLPREALCAVELRDAALLTEDYLQALAAVGARHCVGVHPRAPGAREQRAAVEALPPGPLVVRWNLNPAYGYEEAKEKYAPFDRLMEEDPATRGFLAGLCGDALRGGQPVYLVANNKAEGSAPLTVFKLAEEIAL